MKFLAI